MGQVISPVLVSQEEYLHSTDDINLEPDDNNDTITASHGKCVCNYIHIDVNTIYMCAHVCINALHTCDCI